MKHGIINFVKEDVWLLHEQKLPPFKAALIKSLKVAILSAQGFSRDLCPLRASALTLYSLLSIVPVIAMLFGIAKGFGFEKSLTERLTEQVPHQETTVIQLISLPKTCWIARKVGSLQALELLSCFGLLLA